VSGANDGATGEGGREGGRVRVSFVGKGARRKREKEKGGGEGDTRFHRDLLGWESCGSVARQQA